MITKTFFIIQLENCPHCEESVEALKKLEAKTGIGYTGITVKKSEKDVQGPLIKAITKRLMNELVTYPQTYLMNSDFAEYLTSTELSAIDYDKVIKETINTKYIGTNSELQNYLLEEGGN